MDHALDESGCVACSLGYIIYIMWPAVERHFQPMYIAPVTMLEDVFVTSVIAWWIYELFHFCDCCQRLRVGDKVVHKMSGRQGKVTAVYWISEEIDITVPFSLEASKYWFCISCGTNS